MNDDIAQTSVDEQIGTEAIAPATENEAQANPNAADATATPVAPVSPASTASDVGNVDAPASAETVSANSSQTADANFEGNANIGASGLESGATVTSSTDANNQPHLTIVEKIEHFVEEGIDEIKKLSEDVVDSVENL